MLLQAAPAISMGIVSAMVNASACHMEDKEDSCCSPYADDTDDEDQQCCDDECACIAISATTGLNTTIPAPEKHEESFYKDSNFHYAPPAGETCKHDLFQPPQL